MTAHAHSIQLIALNKLVASPRNVRKQDRKADIDALAASIAAHGLLQNLCVVPTEGDKFEVDAGGRRLAALKQLAKQKVIANDHPIPCHVVTMEQGIEVSLAENVQRVAMDAMDEVDAYAALVAEGATPDDISRRFGVTRRHVDQRLALAGLSPRIKVAWKRGDVSLEAARAFCLVESHAQQEAVFKSLSRPVTHAGSVRARLMEGRMRASDRLAAFVGLEAYECAGGVVVRDLFDAEAVYVENPALMAELAEQKLAGERDNWIAQGWGWVETSLGQGRTENCYAAMRLQPDWRDYTDAEEAELARLRDDLDALDAALDEDSIEEDPRWDARDTLAAAIETLRQSARVWNTDLIGHAGVVIAINHDGEAYSTLGVVRQSDEKTIKDIRKRLERAENGDDAVVDDEAVASPEPETACGLPKSVIRDLSLARTRAIRLLLARDRETSLAVTVAAMIMRTVFRSELSGVGVSASAAHVDDLEALVETRSAILAHVPDNEDEVLDWCLMQPPETLLSVLAVIVADAVDLVHEKGAPSDHRRQSLAKRLAEILDLDMREFWVADASYWTRLPKADLLAAISRAPGVIDQTERSQEVAIKAYAKLKKDELAAKVGVALAGTGYLPDMLVTPVPAGVFDLTSAGLAVAAE
jgi:ParB family transcriptional regulator, chromosome partitioning protein